MESSKDILIEFLRKVFKEDTEWIYEYLNKDWGIENIEDLEELEESHLTESGIIKPVKAKLLIFELKKLKNR
jgi:hypothetical protein